MGGSQKSKRVTWASDVNLCQVRLFLSEESPSQVGTGIQDHLQAKVHWPGQSGSVGSDDNLPPGFEEIQPANPWAARLSQMPLIKWKFPTKFVVNISWQVVAGEESQETEAQTHREMRVLEAIYPRPSAIPPNPAVSPDADDSNASNNHFTTVVPITPIEDEDTPDIPQGPFPSHGPGNVHHQTDIISGIEPDMVAAAQAALGGNLIDRDLLIKILSDPKMFGQLVANHAATSSSSSGFPPAVGTQTVGSSITHHAPASFGLRNTPPSPSTASILNTPSTTTNPPYAPNRRDQIPAPRPTASTPFYPQTRAQTVPVAMSMPSPTMAAAATAPVPRDINYYKNLIQQHGGERRELTTPQYAQPLMATSQEAPTKGRDSKLKRPCIYFNTPRGCRNGANCMYLHDINSTMTTTAGSNSNSQQRVSSSGNSGGPEVQSTKRVKLDT